jgi:hypothetical protein
MDPNTLLDILFVKLTIESQTKQALSSDSFSQTLAILKRIHTPNPEKIRYLRESIQTKGHIQAVARQVITNPLLLETQHNLLKNFPVDIHTNIKEWALKLLTPKTQKVLRRKKSNLRNKSLFLDE